METSDKENKLIDIKDEQVKTVLKNIHDMFNKGLKNGSFELEDNVDGLFQNVAIIFDQYMKLRTEFDKSQKAIEQSLKQSELIKKASV